MTERVRQLTDLLALVAQFPATAGTIDLTRAAASLGFEQEVVTLACALDAVDPAFVVEIAEAVEAAEADPLEDHPEIAAPVRRSYPALQAWQSEVRRGVRNATTPDALHRIACYEAGAKEAEHQHLHEAAEALTWEARHAAEEAAMQCQPS